jgi:hypothetical protein
VRRRPEARAAKAVAAGAAARVRARGGCGLVDKAWGCGGLSRGGRGRLGVRARGGYGGRRSCEGAGLGAESRSGAGKEGPSGRTHTPGRERAGKERGTGGRADGPGKRPMGRARGEKERKERGPRLGCQGEEKKGRKEVASWAGPKKEEREREKENKNKRLLNLN